MNSCNGINIGDIITCYHAGYHKVTAFEDRSYNIGGNPRLCVLVSYIKVANEDGKKSRRLCNKCNIDYCRVITPAEVESDYQNEIQQAELKKANLLKILDGK